MTEINRNTPEEEKLRSHYDSLALTGDDRVTALDYNLRDLEIEYACKYVSDDDALLDIGCGMGVALQAYSSDRKLARAVGIDYAENMIVAAQEKLAAADLDRNIEFFQASVTDLPFSENDFDVVTSHRCLLAILTWERQKAALREIHRVIKPGGRFLMFEATEEGLLRLNNCRRKFDLPEIGEGGRDGYERQLFNENQLLEFLEPLYDVVHIQRFGMYYFLTRIVQPLFVAPELPSYSHRLNDIARQICRSIPDLNGIGHLCGFVLQKKETGTTVSAMTNR